MSQGNFPLLSKTIDQVSDQMFAHSAAQLRVRIQRKGGLHKPQLMRRQVPGKARIAMIDSQPVHAVPHLQACPSCKYEIPVASGGDRIWSTFIGYSDIGLKVLDAAMSVIYAERLLISAK